jgi:hypothetical protein
MFCILLDGRFKRSVDGQAATELKANHHRSACCLNPIRPQPEKATPLARLGLTHYPRQREASSWLGFVVRTQSQS